MKIKLLITLCLCISFMSFITLHGENRYKAIYSGIPLFDQNNKEVNAHGACIVKEGNKYYLFGEYHTDNSNAFTGFSCYSSSNLTDWKFEKIVLPLQTDGLLGPDRIGERVKVMRCPATGEYVMFMHTDNLKYSDPHVGYATCKTINGNYEFKGELLHNGKYLKKWDLGTFQENDGKGYLLTHEGFIYELASDYKSVNRIVVSEAIHGGEAPAMFKKNGTYFWLFSDKTSWERNDNYYLTAQSIKGPWIKRGFFAPKGSLTWNSQSTFVLPIVYGNDTLHLYMGDRWSFPKQGSAATYVWQPISICGDEISIPAFRESWQMDKSMPGWSAIDIKRKSIKEKCIVEQGIWKAINGCQKSKEKGAIISYSFKGKQIGIKALSGKTSGYARISIKNDKNKEIINSIIDFYSKYEYSSQKFLSPILKSGNYTLSIEVLGEHPAWSDKRKADYGSTDNYVMIEDVYTID